MAGDDYYSVREAAKILKRPVTTVRRWLNRGELSGTYDGKTWAVDKAALHERLEALRKAGETPESSTEDRIEALALRAGRAEARAELTEASWSSVLEERVRLREALDEERERRIRAEAELDMERSNKGWWRSFFGY